MNQKANIMPKSRAGFGDPSGAVQTSSSVNSVQEPLATPIPIIARSPIIMWLTREQLGQFTAIHPHRFVPEFIVSGASSSSE